MATRDLTRTYLTLRANANAGSDSPRDSSESILNKRKSTQDPSLLLSNVGGTTDWGSLPGVRNTLPPVWVDTVDSVDDDVQSIMSMMKDLEVL